MAMTEALAATGAQTIPVFALGGVIEARLAMQIKGEHATPRMPALWASLQVVWVGVLLLVGVVDLLAELTCLRFLSHATLSPAAGTFVTAAMMASLAVLATFPLMSLAARAQWFWAKTGVEKIQEEAVAGAMEALTRMLRERLQ